MSVDRDMAERRRLVSAEPDNAYAQKLLQVQENRLVDTGLLKPLRHKDSWRAATLKIKYNCAEYIAQLIREDFELEKVDHDQLVIDLEVIRFRHRASDKIFLLIPGYCPEIEIPFDCSDLEQTIQSPHFQSFLAKHGVVAVYSIVKRDRTHYLCPVQNTVSPFLISRDIVSEREFCLFWHNQDVVGSSPYIDATSEEAFKYCDHYNLRMVTRLEWMHCVIGYLDAPLTWPDDLFIETRNGGKSFGINFPVSQTWDKLSEILMDSLTGLPVLAVADVEGHIEYTRSSYRQASIRPAFSIPGFLTDG